MTARALIINVFVASALATSLLKINWVGYFEAGLVARRFVELEAYRVIETPSPYG
jgi:hypothetical protein